MNPAYFNFGIPMQLVAPPQDAPPQGAGTPKPRPKTPKKITSKDALNSFEKS